MAEYLAAHGGSATVPELGNELGRAGIKYPGRLAPLLAELAAGPRPPFFVGPGPMVSLRLAPAVPAAACGTSGPPGSSGEVPGQGARRPTS